MGNAQYWGAQKPLLSVRDLRTSFFQDEGTTKAVDGASFDVYAGKTLGIVGESGCGKSVTVQSIMRLVPTPPGQIEDGQTLLTLHLCTELFQTVTMPGIVFPGRGFARWIFPPQ